MCFCYFLAVYDGCGPMRIFFLILEISCGWMWDVSFECVEVCIVFLGVEFQGQMVCFCLLFFLAVHDGCGPMRIFFLIFEISCGWILKICIF